MFYTVAYKRTQYGEVERAVIIGKSKEAAYDLALNYYFPTFCGFRPFSAWVESVEYKNGRKRDFNTWEGKRF